MTINLLLSARRRVLMVITAALLAGAVFYAPVLLDNAAGTSLTGAVLACSAPSGGC